MNMLTGKLFSIFIIVFGGIIDDQCTSESLKFNELLQGRSQVTIAPVRVVFSYDP